MKGFVSCTRNIEHLGPFFNDKMKYNGFIPQYDLDCYVVQGYGAFMGITNVNSIDELLEKYYVFYKEYISKGYNLLIGPAPYVAPQHSRGIFCENYLDILIKNEPNKIAILNSAKKLINDTINESINREEIEQYLVSDLHKNVLIAIDLDSPFYTEKLCKDVSNKSKALMLIDFFANYNDIHLNEHISKINNNRNILKTKIDNIMIKDILKYKKEYFNIFKEYENIDFTNKIDIEIIKGIVNKFKDNNQKRLVL